MIETSFPVNVKRKEEEEEEDDEIGNTAAHSYRRDEEGEKARLRFSLTVATP